MAPVSCIFYFLFFIFPKKTLFFFGVCVSARMLGRVYFLFLLANGGGNSGAPALGYWLACWFRRGGFR